MSAVPRLRSSFFLSVWIFLSFSALNVRAQSCQTSSELDDATRTVITTAAQNYFGMAVRGDLAALRQNAMASIAADFSGIERTVKDHQQDLAGAKSTVKSVFLLEAEGKAANPHAEFYCGVFGKNGQTPGSAVFFLDNLAPGKYGVAILEAASATARLNFSIVLQLSGTDWKLGGMYIKSAQVAGHDSDWFTTRAREYKAKGQMHNAWFYYQQARSLISPVPFISTLATDKIYEESQGAQPSDLPASGKPIDLVAGNNTYKVTDIFLQAIGTDLDLTIRYQAADVSNTTQAYQNNLAVIRAVAAKYPEVRDAFTGVVARAVDPSGHDYGTLLPMKDIK